MTHAPDVSARFTCRSCGQSPCVNPSLCAACDREAKQHPRRRTPREARTWQLLGNVSLESMYAAYLRNRPAPEALVEALAYQLRGGVNALNEPSALRRISELDEAQMKDIAERLSKWRWGKLAPAGPRRLPREGDKGAVPPWDPEQINMFIKIWGKTHRDKNN
jgi:hypothetical protein